jgi:hypothetical protein
MRQLNRFYPNVICSHQVYVEFKFLENKLLTIFRIEAKNLFYNSRFGLDYKKNWGLWSYDVVEIFLRREGQSYLEVQSSPLAQPFILCIDTPRKKYQYPEKSEIEISADIDEHGFKVQMNIPYKEIPGSGSIVQGNAYAILGSKEQREHFYLFNLDGDTVDFHQPNKFQDIGTLI